MRAKGASWAGTSLTGYVTLAEPRNGRKIFVPEGYDDKNPCPGSNQCLLNIVSGKF